uniref:EF-hand domain-containing protein n=1 Tax=Haptolina ericina TaxID=156174 RepID=A0A7S3B3G1_9EUKA|mmetsp:Transcript_49412/g.111121  ORF Transcript_49412/g.111121 Transcript_49412/m.111121 type:complete len:139 (+) Transcript_49412:475-891(+)
MTFLKVIDTDADGNVTEDEWHAAWRNGSFDVDETGRGTHKEQVMSKHLSAQSQSIQSSRASTADGTSEPSTPAKAKKSRRFSIILARVQDATVEANYVNSESIEALRVSTMASTSRVFPDCAEQRAGSGRGRGGLSVE